MHEQKTADQLSAEVAQGMALQAWEAAQLARRQARWAMMIAIIAALICIAVMIAVAA